MTSHWRNCHCQIGKRAHVDTANASAATYVRARSLEGVHTDAGARPGGETMAPRLESPDAILVPLVGELKQE
jgi:hypothetical protein